MQKSKHFFLLKFILLKKKFKYREILGEIVSGCLFMLIQFSFFQNFITNRKDFTSESFFIYIVFSLIISSSCSVTLVQEFCLDFHKRVLYKRFIFMRQPFFYIVKYYFLEKIFSLMFFSIIFLSICLAVGLIPIEFLKTIPLFSLTVSLAFLLDIFLRIILTCILMKNKNYQSLLKAYNQIERILSGAIVPLSFFPLALKNLLFYLPFYFLLFFPLEVLLNGIKSNIFFIQLGLTLLFFFISFFIFNLTVKKLKERGEL